VQVDGSEEFGRTFGFPIRAVTTNREKKARGLGVLDGTPSRDVKQDFVILHAPDSQTARQVERALKHLIVLSGGKKELFEDD
jgi:hypothetical protein